MREYRILTDGSCDLAQAWLAEHRVTVLPLYYSLGGSPLPYPGGASFRLGEFYSVLRGGAVVTTSAPSIEDCKSLMRPLLEAGYDLLYTGLAAHLSGMFNVVRLAAMDLKEEFPGCRIAVLDSNAASLGLGLLIEALVTARESGQDFEAACEICRTMRLHLRHYFTVSDLMHLKRGGRISGSAAVVGSMLQIMPMLYLSAEGQIEVTGKQRGRKNALRALAECVAEAAGAGAKVCIAHADAAEDAAFVRDILRRRYPGCEVVVGEIGPVLGAHCGPGGVAAFTTETNSTS
ncbi:MAG: DegV family protein [Oscillospiraceae bacterium]|nr:DegV family protein [Oscillospiraceae bacterium]